MKMAVAKYSAAPGAEYSECYQYDSRYFNDEMILLGRGLYSRLNM